MRYVKWIFLFVIVAIIGAFLHYTLPQHDVVRIVDANERRVDPGTNSIFWSRAGSGDTIRASRDVFFIDAIRENGKPIVFRNEDTGWIWPPYFKFDSANVQAIASDLTSTQAAPRWVRIRHYGWRFEWLSIFPNAVSLKEASGPDDKGLNWTNMIFFALLAVFALWVWRIWRNFRTKRIEPLLDDLDETYDETRARGRGLWRRFTGR
jgi:hypothetical protein